VLGQIFFKSQNKIQDPAKLYKLIDMIDREQWSTMGADVKGKIYEGLLEKNAEDTKSGAGQYFTPRALIRAMVACMRPQPEKTIADPACGTGGFMLAAYDFLADPAHYKLTRDQKEFLKHKTFYGNEIVPGTRRLALMNLFLHNIGDFESDSFISPADALISDTGLRVDYVLANPPFGKKSSMTFTNEEGEQASFRTNIHFTLKKNPLKLEDLQDFIACYCPENPRKRQETYHPQDNPEGRWRRFTYEEILARDKTSLDITWLKDRSLTDLDNLPDPDLLANEIIENLEAGIESFREIYLSVK